MPAITESTKRKLSLLQLAEELGNVSKACRIMGYHRDTFYEVHPDHFSSQRDPGLPLTTSYKDRKDPQCLRANVQLQ